MMMTWSRLYALPTALNVLIDAGARRTQTPTSVITMSASTLVFFICLFVGCTTLPMTIDLLRVFLPRKLLTGRLVEAWQRPLLLAMVVCLCVWALVSFFEVVKEHHAFSVQNSPTYTSDHLAAVQPHVRRGDALGKAFGARSKRFLRPSRKRLEGVRSVRQEEEERNEYARRAEP